MFCFGGFRILLLDFFFFFLLLCLLFFLSKSFSSAASLSACFSFDRSVSKASAAMSMLGKQFRRVSMLSLRTFRFLWRGQSSYGPERWWAFSMFPWALSSWLKKAVNGR